MRTGLIENRLSQLTAVAAVIICAVALGLLLGPMATGPGGEEIPGGLRPAAGVTDLGDPNGDFPRFQGAETDQRVLLPAEPRQVHVVDWLGESVPHGEVAFCDASSVSRYKLGIDGSAEIPGMDWTHLLVATKNQIPEVFEREELANQSGVAQVQLPEPTLLAQLVVPVDHQGTVDLAVDHPWAETSEWPAPLREAYPLQPRMPLEIDEEAGTVSFFGSKKYSTTVSVGGGLMFQTSEGLRSTLSFPPGSLSEVLMLESMPLLAVELVSEDPSLLERDLRVHVLFSGSETLEPLAAIKSSSFGEGVEFEFDPSFPTASITVSEVESTKVLGWMTVALFEEDEIHFIDLSEKGTTVLVTDKHGAPIEDVTVVQNHSTVGHTDSNGRIYVPIVDDSSNTWFLERGHGATGIPTGALADIESVEMPIASGLLLACSPLPTGQGLFSAGRVTLENIIISDVVNEAGLQTAEIYGVSVLSADVNKFEATYMLQCIPAGGEASEYPLAGIFHLQAPATGNLILSDAQGQELHVESITLLPGAIQRLSLDLRSRVRQIEATVVDAELRPVSGAFVFVGPYADVIPAAVSTLDGSFSLVASRETQVLTVQAAGYVTRSVEYPIRSLDGKVVLQESRELTVQVVDDFGRRVDAELVMHTEGSKWAPYRVAEGVYKFSALPRHGLTVVATLDGVEFSLPIEANLTETTIELVAP